MFNRTELTSRAEIEYELYAKQINIEARAMVNIASKQILPAVMCCERKIAEGINEIKSAVPGADTSVQEEILTELSSLLKEAKNGVKTLTDERNGSIEKRRGLYGSYGQQRRLAPPELRRLTF